jgi:hypothetical protein
MRNPTRRLEVDQLNLFHAARHRPTWRKLPTEVRERSVALLAKLLNEHRARPLGGGAAREVGDE